MAIFHFFNSSMNYFVGILSIYMLFLLNVAIVWVNWKMLATVDEGVDGETRTLIAPFGMTYTLWQ